MSVLGTPPMPWQEYAADVIGEVRADGRPRWPMVIISVPRQSGKSTLVKAAAVHRILTKPGAKVWLTAQTGSDASDLWEECRKDVSISPIASLFTARKARGSEALTCKLTKGEFRPHPPTEDKLHGKQSDLNIIDEAWSFDEAQAHALMQAIVPTQTTRPGAQIIIVSTMGTARSTWFHGLCDAARAGDESIALLEWGLEPGDDASDLDLVASRHPAIGHTASMESLSSGLAGMNGNLAEFARAYGNRRTGARERLIPLEAWERVNSTDVKIPTDVPVIFSAAGDEERTETVIAAAYTDRATGLTMAEIVDRRPGVTWAAPRLQKLLAKHQNSGVIIDKISPASTVADELERREIEIQKVTTRDLVTACQGLYDAIIADPPTVSILPNRTLDAAVEIVERRRIGEGWAWNRKSGGSIASLEAVTLAVYAARHVPAPARKPFIRM